MMQMKSRPLGVHWLASYPKSGNTWIRAFIDALVLGKVDINSLACVRSDANRLFYRLITSYPVEELDQAQVRLLRPAMLHEMATCWNWHLCPCIVKTHWQARQNHKVLDLPSVYLVRDPRDVCVSLASHAGCDLETAVHIMSDKNHYWLHNGIDQEVGNWSDHVRSWQGRAKAFRYEDLGDEQTLGEIAKVFGLDGDVQKASFLSHFDVLNKQEQKFGFSEKHGMMPFFRSGKAGGWKDVLGRKTTDLIVSQHREAMQAFGYI